MTASFPDVAVLRRRPAYLRWLILSPMLVARPTLVFLAALPLLGACASGVSSNDGDCNARIRYDGVIYRPHNALSETASRGPELGVGDVIGCGEGVSAPKVDKVTVYAVENVPHSIVVKTRRGEWQGIYVAEGVAQADWPSVLRRP
jgi:hypothetical protein